MKKIHTDKYGYGENIKIWYVKKKKKSKGMSVYIVLSKEGRIIIWRRNKQKKQLGGGNIYIHFARQCAIFFLGRSIRKYTNSYLWGQSLGKAFNFHLLMLPYLDFHAMCMCRQWAYGTVLLSSSYSFLHTETYMCIHTWMLKCLKKNESIQSLSLVIKSTSFRAHRFRWKY